MHGAQCVRAYLRIQHTVEQAIVTAAPPATPVLPFGTQGVLSPDFRKAAALAFVASRPTLQVRDVSDGHLVHEWSLPRVPAAYVPEPGWNWAPGGQYLTMPFGLLWHMPWGPLRYTGAASQSSQMVAGLLHVDLHAGATVVNTLLWSGDGMAKAHYWTDCDLILVLVQLGDETTARIFSSCGMLLRSICDLPSFAEVWLGPAGQAAACLDDCGLVWLLWDLATDTAAVTQVEGQRVLQLAWATPCMGQAALLLHSNGSEGYLKLVQQQQLVQRVFGAGALDSEVCNAAWGCRLVLQANRTQLHLYSLSGGSLTWERGVTPQPGREYTQHPLTLSANGALCALVTGARRKDSQQLLDHLGILHLASGCLREYSLSGRYMASTVKVRWSQDCSAVMVTDVTGSHRRVFRFC